MERKIIFLDIDGVLQPLSSQKRFKHIYHKGKEGDISEYFECLERKFNIDYRKYNKYDVGAVLFDWNKESLALLKLTLSLTGALIVLSSAWRREGNDRMKDFFTIHGLEKYYIDNTRNYSSIGKGFIEEKDNESHLNYRSVEILEWLSRNPDVKKWVAIDDMYLEGLDGHFIGTSPRYKWKNAEKAIRILCCVE